jgi:hypothetical protein
MKKIKNSVIVFSMLIMSYQPTQSQTIELPDWPDHPEENICRCKYDGCYGGNLISFRSRCGQGDCSSSASNCYSSVSIG